MISDVLSETVEGLDWYLNEPLYDDMYTGELRERIIQLRNEAEKIRIELDFPPELFPRNEDSPNKEE